MKNICDVFNDMFNNSPDGDITEGFKAAADEDGYIDLTGYELTDDEESDIAYLADTLMTEEIPPEKDEDYNLDDGRAAVSEALWYITIDVGAGNADLLDGWLDQLTGCGRPGFDDCWDSPIYNMTYSQKSALANVVRDMIAARDEGRLHDSSGNVCGID